MGGSIRSGEVGCLDLPGQLSEDGPSVGFTPQRQNASGQLQIGQVEERRLGMTWFRRRDPREVARTVREKAERWEREQAAEKAADDPALSCLATSEECRTMARMLDRPLDRPNQPDPTDSIPFLCGWDRNFLERMGIIW